MTLVNKKKIFARSINYLTSSLLIIKNYNIKVISKNYHFLLIFSPWRYLNDIVLN